MTSKQSSRETPPIPSGACNLRERDQRLEALLALGGRLAHDFNNYLAPILGYLALAREEAPADSTMKQYLQSMELSARKAEGMVRDLANACRAGRKTERKLTDLAQLIESELALWQASLPNTANIVVEQSLIASVLPLDESQWRLALNQVFRNAHFALATGGLLKLDLRRVSLSPEAASDLGLLATDAVLLTFTDNGFGIPPQFLSRAFEPFASTRPKTHGLGLGLTMVHAIVRGHGGQIVLESREDVGTSIRIWLPVTEKPSERPNRLAEAVTENHAFREKPKVLIVEDDALVVEVIRSCLQKADFDVLTAPDGAEGLKLYQKHAATVALVISDLSTPKMNGVELAEAIRGMNPSAVMIFISGGEKPLLEEQLARIKGPQPLLIKKPFQLRALVEAVKEVAS